MIIAIKGEPVNNDRDFFSMQILLKIEIDIPWSA